ncbi:NUDIX hydrolase [Candidatus Gracilibacteria bacterium]|nr:NUDIX hydrolase [Candidatus Gracilibacteria bacterium]
MVPDQAKLVFKGKLYDTYQWQQEMFDGSMATFEMLKRPYNGCVIPVIDGKIMVLEQVQPGKPPFLSLPGGRCDPGEDTLTAAKRELLEETGYRATTWSLWLETIPEEKVDWQIHTYIAQDCVSEETPRLDSGERIKTKLITFEEFLLLSDNPLFRNKDAITELLRVRLDPVRKEQLRTLLFGAA